ncbi:flagellin-like periplasmic protein [Cupriavidus basilensis OR16]|uniref:Flagellin-like periplasmic protein n=2 Tax=Cupriavidus basilensis TaxID=68895 RepID=H1S4J2_9BURK|nr:flagellin-like periplasmic protein [Cupriavidus basilensis OR16]
MFQTSSKPGPNRRSGAGSATAVVLLGAGLACAGQVRADEGTGLEALDTHDAADAASLNAPARQAESSNPYLAAALGSMAGWNPAQQQSSTEPSTQVQADQPLADQPLADGQGDPLADLLASKDAIVKATSGAASGAKSGPSSEAPAAESPRVLAQHDSATGWKPVVQERLQDLRGGFAAAARPAPETMDDGISTTPSTVRAQADAPRVHAARSTMASWKPVAQDRLDDLRGGFDVGGLQVSFGIERAVIINGALVVATSITIPDVSRITADQATRLAAALGVAAGSGAAAGAAVSNALASNPVTGANGSSSTGASSSSTGASASAAGTPGTSVTSLPASAIAAASAAVTSNGVLNLIQNGPGNSVAASALAGSPATVIQNTLNNQSIQSLVTINAGVNTLQAFRSEMAGLALSNALLNSASRR